MYKCRCPRLQFEYTNPCVGFDRSNVKGPVAKLIKLKDTSTATALEVTAGGKVVDWWIHNVHVHVYLLIKNIFYKWKWYIEDCHKQVKCVSICNLIPEVYYTFTCVLHYSYNS